LRKTLHSATPPVWSRGLHIDAKEERADQLESWVGPAQILGDTLPRQTSLIAVPIKNAV
jgi:hypothetical protein